MPLTAIVLAAGEGTRMKSRHPKIVHKLLDKPLVWWSVNAAITAGADRVIVVVGNHADEVKSALSCFPSLEYVAQTERLGTGHAVKVVKDALGGFKGPVVVINGDASLLRAQSILDLVAETKAHHNACTVLTMTPPDPTGYGRVISSNGQVTAIVEHKDATPEQREQERECNVGVYCFCGGRLTANIDLLGNDNVQGEYYLTDMVSLYVSQGEPVAAVHVDDYKEALGVNSRSELAVATRIMQERINEHWMSQGVTMLDPTSVWIGPEVTLGMDTEVLPQTMLYGKTSIGENCVVGPNTRLTDTLVGNDAVVDETVAINAQVDDFATCGPRAYLRPGTHLMPHAKAGTHVEIKNSTIGEGSKVPHLSYIGDTTMGSGVNIGAGSITCNYDGYHKFKTNIGNNVFVGSDTMMVAPVSIGDGALVGASSCITKDVPADALALERSEQKIVEGYAAQRRHKLEKEDWMFENLSDPLLVARNIKLYTGTGNPELARKVADILHLELQGLLLEKFANGEIYARFDESVRGDEVFFIQSLAGVNVNDLVMETLIVADAAKRASANSFTVVIPHYAYARQDRKAAAREPITARLMANLLENAGVDRVITLDLHQGQIQGFFDIPVSHLTALYLLGDYFKSKPFDWENTVVVSPDMGRAKAAKKLSDYLDCGLAIAHKSRPRHNESAVMGIIGDIKGKTCIVNDDMIDTAGTLCASVVKLKEMGAGDIYVCATHGVFSGPAIERLNNAPIEECVVTDAIPCAAANKEGSKIKTITIANELAEAIYAVYTDRPVSDIFGGDFNL